MPPAQFIQADMTAVALPSGAFDAVSAFYSITHVPRDEHGGLLRRIAGWLKPGGRFLASFGVTPLNGCQDDWLGTTMFFSHHGADETRRLVLDGAGLRDDPKGPLFRTIGRGTDKLTRTVLPQANAFAMIRRRAAAAGIETKLGNHSFRATGITAYLKNGSTLEKAAAMANHASTRTTQLYDRRRDEVCLDEIERIVI